MEDIRPDSSQTLRLLDQVQAGNRDALGQLLNRHRPHIEAAVAGRLDRRMRSRLDASDIVQDSQIEAIQRIDDYLAARPMPFHLWLMRAAHQRLLKAERRHLQTAKRKVDREVPLPDRTSLQLLAGIAARVDSPSDLATREEMARQVRRILARLPEHDREIIMLRNFDGLSNGEASCLLEISREAAKKRYARALLRLHELLRAEGLSGGES
jgi:RNA polymerase sigma-70 factor (ECF subfamily)